MEVPKMDDELSPEKKVSWVRSHIIGGWAEFDSPFGRRRVTYADATATARSLRFIEDYLLTTLLPFYDSYVGQHSTKMVEEASQYIKSCLRGKKEDAILFCGSGSTGAIKKLQEVMGIAIAPTLKARVSKLLHDEQNWVVFVGPYEHHSNILSWRQSLADVVEIGLTENGSVDIKALKAQLQHYECSNSPMLGSFSACSNVTGIVADTRALARLLHQHGAFACFDFATSGPYVKIDMKSGELDGYDAVFISPHKFIGGPGSPGILLMNKKLYQLNNYPPSTCGGGTVSYVNCFSEEDTVYLESIEERENAGTPQIIQTVRAALAFWIKEYVGYKTITNQESYYMSTALETLGNYSNIHILGPLAPVDRISVLSFLVYPTTNRKPLHGRFVAKLLNDLFGIQARGGCSCAGPYGHYLLNIDKAESLAFRSSILQGYQGVKPAWTRINFPYYMSREEFEFVLEAVKFVAHYGHQFLPLYDLDWGNGNWNLNDKTFKQVLDGKYNTKFLQKLKLRYNYKQVKDNNNATFGSEDECLTNKYASYIDKATYIASLLPKYPRQGQAPHDLRHIDLPFII
ncbi:uncharacterized protein LOC141623231 isoform X2 [Silene latifolia]|uniref:uncharacterized protein LOC141623231 isoform X2 n=1 Tax=Silene latifolia TaxID=37657 RepID=UPI003D7809FA